MNCFIGARSRRLYCSSIWSELAEWDSSGLAGLDNAVWQMVCFVMALA
jgi:hypothetical protein